MVGMTQPDSLTGLPMNELSILLPLTFTTQFINSSLVEVPARVKTLVIVASTITSGGAQQATVQLFAARTRYAVLGGDTGTAVWGTGSAVQPTTPFTATQGATSQFPTTGPNATQARGTAVSLGPSTASLSGIFFFSPIDIPELQWEYPVLGIQITAPATFTGGAATAFFELASV